jgi:hypothetical protein
MAGHVLPESFPSIGWFFTRPAAAQKMIANFVDFVDFFLGGGGGKA